MKHYFNFQNPYFRGGGEAIGNRQLALQPRLANKRLAMPIRHLFALLLLLPLFWGCDKEPLSPDDAVPGSALIGERSGPSQAEIQEALAAIDSIKAFKEQVDRWRDGQELSKSMDAEQAAEQVETAINFYISKPGQAYEDYTTVVDSVSVPTSSSTWSGAQIADFFNAMKGRLVHHFDQVSGTGKAYQFVDMGAPVVDGGSSKVYFIANIGQGVVTEDPLPAIPNGGSNCDPDFGEVRWARNLGLPTQPTQKGFTLVSCSGAADEAIGTIANQHIGFVQKNETPSLFNPANDNPIRSDVVIASPIDHVQTNFFGTEFPLGGVGGLAPSPLFIISLFRQEPEWAFPFLLNPTEPCNEFPDYKRFGQYKIHADFSDVLTQGFPDESCFGLDKFVSYIHSNIAAGQFYTFKVNETLFPNGPPPFAQRRRLLSTLVQSVPLGPVTIDTGQTLTLQEHPTYHFYAAFFLMADDDPGLARKMPSEL